MTDHYSAELIEEIPAALARAGRPLTLREILAHVDGLADGPASLAEPLRVLCRDGILAVADNAVASGGPRRYCLAEPATTAAPEAVAEPPPAMRANYGGAATNISRVLAILVDGRELHREQIAQLLDMDADKISDLLWKLARRGLAEKLGHGFWRGTGAGPQAAPAVAPPPARAARKTHHVPVELKALVRRHVDNPPAPPADIPVMAWRSDGVVELRRPDAIIEITAAELAALSQFAARFTGQEFHHD